MKNKKSRKPKKLAVCLASLLAGVALFIPAGCGDKANNNTNPNPNNNFQIVVDSSIEEENQNLSVTAGTTIASLKSQLEVEGYTLVGLYKDEDYSQPYEDSYVLQSGDKVYCKYEIKHFTITLNDEDWYEIVPEGELTNVEYGSEFKFKVTYTEDRDEAAIKVTANDEVLTKGQDEYYTTTIKADTTINVQIKTYTITIPEQVTVTYKEQTLQTGETVLHGDEITVSYTKKDGYTQTVKVNYKRQEEASQTYAVTKDMIITYNEEIISYSLSINAPDKVTVKRNEEVLQAQNAVLLYGDELEITYIEQQEGYNVIFIVDGATKQENNKYLVNGNVSIVYSLEEEPPMTDKLAFTFETNCYSVKAKNQQIEGKIVIPSTYNDGQHGRYPVYVPGYPEFAFGNCKLITQLIIGDKVTSIGDQAFNSCTGLTSVTIGSSVEQIGEFAFANCTSLTEIIYNAKECEDFKHQDFIFDGAGKNTDGVSVIIGEQVKHIPACLFEAPFNSKPNIKSVTIGSHVESIGYYAFGGCQGLETIVIPDSVITIEAAFKDCEYLRNATIGSNVETLNGSFDGCKWLETIIIPESVITIGDNAFEDCTSLRDVTIGSNVETIGDNAFSGCRSLKTIIIPESVITIGSAFKNCEYLSDVTIGSNVETLNGTFSGCTNLKTIVIPESVISLNGSLSGSGGTFSGCRSLKTIIIPDSVITIGERAFYECTSLTSVTIGSHVETIGLYAFNGCTGLETIVIPESVTEIGEGAFSATSLKTIIIPESVTIISYGIFSGCRDLTSVTIGSHVETIKNNAFQNCSNLNEVIINSATVFNAIAQTASSNGWLTNYLKSETGTIKVLKTIVDDAENNPMPDYLSQNFTKSPDDTDQDYYIFTKKAA